MESYSEIFKKTRLRYDRIIAMSLWPHFVGLPCRACVGTCGAGHRPDCCCSHRTCRCRNCRHRCRRNCTTCKRWLMKQSINSIYTSKSKCNSQSRTRKCDHYLSYPNLRNKSAKWTVEIMRFEVTTEGVCTSTSSESWREWVSCFNVCNAKLSAPNLVLKRRNYAAMRRFVVDRVRERFSNLYIAVLL